ncbi:hypothetical protein SI65_09133 [Aspergillus cristatus]|uniref:Cobalamin-independent methionine synthase MetE C-terminal/archaeal domain-containing protein n=1 Tax=Aspergillus cristatus TaxID=573508 RepID=A0A1E3B3J1_ASPCR|nr:hypothetical protein SI65_09133 [Aspergillus cristatus]
MAFPLHRNPPFRAEHVGSLLRPDYLLEVRHAWNDKKCSNAQSHEAEDRAVNEVVKLQQDCGFRAINDGEEGSAYPKDIYRNDDEYFADVVAAYQTELQILYDHGLRNVQIDDPNMCYFCNEKMIENFNNDKLNARTTDELFTKYINVYNKIMTQCPQGMHIGLHLCRGNLVKSRHFTEGPYDRITKELLQKVNVHTFHLEFDTERAGGCEPLQYLPHNKNVVLGVVSSKYPELENFDATVARVYDAAGYISKRSGRSEMEALEQICVSPQCGFASHSSGNAVGVDDMVAKMRLVRRVADKIWPGDV